MIYLHVLFLLPSLLYIFNLLKNGSVSFWDFAGYIGSVSFLNTVLQVAEKLRSINPGLIYGKYIFHPFFVQAFTCFDGCFDGYLILSTFYFMIRSFCIYKKADALWCLFMMVAYYKYDNQTFLEPTKFDPKQRPYVRLENSSLDCLLHALSSFHVMNYLALIFISSFFLLWICHSIVFIKSFSIISGNLNCLLKQFSLFT